MTAKCAPHVCKPVAASTLRQIHSILSGTLDAAVRWDWISTNPTKAAKRPKQKPPQPDPPSPAVAAHLVEAAFEMDDDWGTLVWLVMTTGIRRGVVCALRWSRVDAERLGINTHIHALRHYSATKWSAPEVNVTDPGLHRVPVPIGESAHASPAAVVELKAATGAST